MSCSQNLSGSVHHYTDSKAFGFKPHKGSLGRDVEHDRDVGSSGEPFGESRLPEGSGNIARSHKSRREEEAKENDQVH